MKIITNRGNEKKPSLPPVIISTLPTIGYAQVPQKPKEVVS